LVVFALGIIFIEIEPRGVFFFQESQEGDLSKISKFFWRLVFKEDDGGKCCHTSLLKGCYLKVKNDTF